MKRLDEVPDGWYEKNKVSEILLVGSQVSLIRREKQDGLASYHLNLYNEEFPLEIQAWNKVINEKKNPPIEMNEYKYLENDFSTKTVYEMDFSIWEK